MSPFELDALIWPVIAIFLVTLGVSFYSTGWIATSIFSALLKAGIYIIYFGIFFNGTFTFLDDWSYLDGAYDILRIDIGLTNLLYNFDSILQIGRGDHFVYYLYNSYAIKVFGDGYYSPVALNILISVIIAYVGSELARVEFRLTKLQSRLFYFFILLHPDILAWSNVMNGKDILVLLLHVQLLLAISLLYRRKIFVGVTLGVSAIMVLFFLRFYVPLLFAAAFFTSGFVVNKSSYLKHILFSVGLVVLALFWMGSDVLIYVFESMQDNLVNPIYGFVRVLLTPIPFGTDEAYAFLDFPALIHWVLIPFAFLGFICIWRMNGSFLRFFCIYILLFLAVYAVYGELQGPRHRIQLDFAFALCQFIGIVTFAKMMRKKAFSTLNFGRL